MRQARHSGRERSACASPETHPLKGLAEYRWHREGEHADANRTECHDDPTYDRNAGSAFRPAAYLLPLPLETGCSRGRLSRLPLCPQTDRDPGVAPPCVNPHKRRGTGRAAKEAAAVLPRLPARPWKQCEGSAQRDEQQDIEKRVAEFQDVLERRQADPREVATLGLGPTLERALAEGCQRRRRDDPERDDDDPAEKRRRYRGTGPPGDGRESRSRPRWRSRAGTREGRPPGPGSSARHLACDSASDRVRLPVPNYGLEVVVGALHRR